MILYEIIFTVKYFHTRVLKICSIIDDNRINVYFHSRRCKSIYTQTEIHTDHMHASSYLRTQGNIIKINVVLVYFPFRFKQKLFPVSEKPIQFSLFVPYMDTYLIKPLNGRSDRCQDTVCHLSWFLMYRENVF